MAKKRERLFRTSCLALEQRKLVGEVDEELAIAKSLPRRHYHDAGEVELDGFFLLAEVANHVIAVGLALTQDVKVKGVDLVPDVLVVKEEFGQVAQVLCVDLLLLGVEFKHREGLVPVDLVAWRTPYLTPL